MSNPTIVTYELNASVEAEQHFNLDVTKGITSKKIKEDFSKMEFSLDPAPPCDWAYELRSIDVKTDMKEKRIVRLYSVFLTLRMDRQQKRSVEKFLKEQEYYSKARGYNWVAAINYMIAYTTFCPDYASWDREWLNIEHWQSESTSYGVQVTQSVVDVEKVEKKTKPKQAKSSKKMEKVDHSFFLRFFEGLEIKKSIKKTDEEIEKELTESINVENKQNKGEIQKIEFINLSVIARKKYGRGMVNYIAKISIPINIDDQNDSKKLRKIEDGVKVQLELTGYGKYRREESSFKNIIPESIIEAAISMFEELRDQEWN